MPFPVQQLPYLLQESILEHLGIGEALRLLQVKKNFRICVQCRGPFLKKFNSIEMNHWKQITRINEDGFKAVSIKIDDFIFETTTNLLVNEVNKNQILIDQRFSKLFNRLHFCKKLDVWERNFQGIPKDSKEFDFLTLLPQKIRFVDNFLISAFRLCSMNAILRKLDRISYRAICIRFYLTYSLPEEIPRVREYLEMKASNAVALTLGNSLSIYWEALQKISFRTILVLLSRFASFTETAKLVLQAGIPSQYETAIFRARFDAVENNGNELFEELKRLTMSSYGIEETSSISHEFAFKVFRGKFDKCQKKAFFRKTYAQSKFSYFGLFSHDSRVYFCCANLKAPLSL